MDYVEGYMGYEKDDAMKKNEDYYKQYSNKAKTAVKSAIGIRDAVINFLFENHRIAGRKVVRRMNIDAENIELPSELFELAQMMPDAMDVLELSDKQEVME